MAERDILLIGNPVLYERAEAVANPRQDRIVTLARDMKDTLVASNAIAMAAPQIGVLDRVVIFELPESRIPSGSRQQPIPWTVMINPVLEKLTDQEQRLWERCLSIPNYYARIGRCTPVRARFKDLDGVPRELVGSGYLAALMQHECDHLDGILYTMRMRTGQEMAAVSVVCDNENIYRYSAAEFDGMAYCAVTEA